MNEQNKLSTKASACYASTHTWYCAMMSRSLYLSTSITVTIGMFWCCAIWSSCATQVLRCVSSSEDTQQRGEHLFCFVIAFEGHLRKATPHNWRWCFSWARIFPLNRNNLTIEREKRDTRHKSCTDRTWGCQHQRILAIAPTRIRLGEDHTFIHGQTFEVPMLQFILDFKG